MNPLSNSTNIQGLIYKELPMKHNLVENQGFFFLKSSVEENIVSLSKVYSCK